MAKTDGRNDYGPTGLLNEGSVHGRITEICRYEDVERCWLDDDGIRGAFLTIVTSGMVRY